MALILSYVNLMEKSSPFTKGLSLIVKNGASSC